MSAWDTLGIPETPEEGAIRQAYATRVRQWRPDTHPQEFARLRAAYEQALRWARTAVRASTVSEPVAAATDLPVLPPAPAADAMIHELAHCFSTEGEIAAIGLLRQQYALVSAHTIDTRLDWEQVLLASVLGAETPPLSLVFEGDRLLGWRDRHADVAQMFGHEVAQRLRVLLDLAHETTYLRFFSPNRWQRRIFGAGSLPWFGMTVQVEVARHSVDWWSKLAQEASRPSLQELLDARVLRRLGGLLLLSTDVLLALLLACVFAGPLRELSASQQPWIAPVLTAAVFVLALPLPLLARWWWDTPPARRLRRWRDAVQRQPFAVRAIALGVLLAASIIALAADAPLPVRVAGGAVLALTGATMLVMVLLGVWCVLRFFEQLVALPWLWLQRTWGLHAFRGVVEGGETPRWRDQLAALPGTLAADWRLHRARRRASAEQARQEREAQRSNKAKARFNYWWIFWGIVALQAVVRLAK